MFIVKFLESLKLTLFAVAFTLKEPVVVKL